jgi:hypothetical protein
MSNQLGPIDSNARIGAIEKKIVDIERNVEAILRGIPPDPKARLDTIEKKLGLQ